MSAVTPRKRLKLNVPWPSQPLVLLPPLRCSEYPPNTVTLGVSSCASKTVGKIRHTNSTSVNRFILSSQMERYAESSDAGSTKKDCFQPAKSKGLDQARGFRWHPESKGCCHRAWRSSPQIRDSAGYFFVFLRALGLGAAFFAGAALVSRPPIRLKESVALKGN